MARLILKWRYIKSGTPAHSKNLVKYIATREGVEQSDESWKTQPATVEQQRLIKQLLSDFPTAKDSHEYEDYCQKKTKQTASEFIGRTIEENLDVIGKKENYVGYIAMRPRVEKIGTHGLFSQDDAPINLGEVAKEVAEHKGVVWTTVLSLRREDAIRLGYDNARAWKFMLRSQADELAKAMGIPTTDLRWYAAFHNEGNHPHVHLISYSTGQQPYMNQRSLEKWKSRYAQEIFKQDLTQVYKDQTELRDELRKLGKEQLAEIISRINGGEYDSETVALMLTKLSEVLKNTSGKKVYGYLPKKAKNLVNGIVDELSKDERIAELYDLWWRQKDIIVGTYTTTMPTRIPLSQNDTFKDIRNAVIAETMNIVNGVEPVEEPDEEPIEDDEEPTDEEMEIPRTRAERRKLMWDLYREAKEHLDRDSESYDPHKAVNCLIDSARLGNTIAKYKLGKMFLRGDEVQKNIEYALRWLEEAVAEENEYAEYLLGKTYLKGEDIDQDLDRAEELLRRSADRGNKYAAYTLAKALLDGDNTAKDKTEALEYLKHSADKGFAPAEYLLGKILYKGEMTEQDIPAAIEYLERAASKNNAYAAYLAGKIRLTEESVKDIRKAIQNFEIAAKNGNAYAEYQLGKIYLFGKDEVPPDYDKGMEYLKSAAEHGNEYAEHLVNNIKNNQNWSASMGAFRLFHHLSRMIQDRLDDGKPKGIGGIDRKLRRQIEEKKQAQGLKQG